MESRIVTYELRFASGEVLRFDVNPWRESAVPGPDAPAWTRLEHHQCRVCPLPGGSTTHCPAALDVQAVIEGFTAGDSTEELEVWVRTPQRSHTRRCKTDDAAHSILSLILTTSACPVLSRLRGLARFHVPFATTEEIFLDTISHHLLEQYYRAARGLPPDLSLDGLLDFFRVLEDLNADFFRRIRDACESDAGLNAVVRLNSICQLVVFSLPGFLAELEADFRG